MGYLTGNTSAAASFICRRVYIPDELALVMAVNGALLELTKPRNWEQHGAATPVQVAALMQTMFFGYLDSDCEHDTMPLGSVIPYLTAAPPDGYLPCDGTVYSADDYPAFWAVVDDAWKVGVDTFKTPDLRGRTVIGAGAGAGLTNRSIGAMVGSENHMLGYSELFPHNHQGFHSTSNVSIHDGPSGNPSINAAAPATAVFQGVTPSGTQTAFNIMQPSQALPYCVKVV